MPLTFYEHLLFKKHHFCEDKEKLSLNKIINECKLPSFETLRFQQEEFLKEFVKNLCASEGIQKSAYLKLMMRKY
jgi:hypothetical protein